MQSETTILYVADPMCSWCWGFAPTIRHLQEAFPQMSLRLALGGLAADSAEPMDAATRDYVQQAWHSVAQRTGAKFNFDFWQSCAPRRSTYPACRAVVLARKVGLEMAMFQAIQQAYYLHAENPSNDDTLVRIAQDLGMDAMAFSKALHSEETQETLRQDFLIREKLEANSFPSLGLLSGNDIQLLHSGWCNPSTAEKLIRGAC